MNRISRFGLGLGLAATLALGACGDDAADTNGADSTATSDSMSFTAPDSSATLPTNADSNSTAGPDSTGQGDVGADGDSTATTSSGGNAGANDDVAALVEAQIMIMHSDVKVSSEGDGAIVLSGTVNSEQEKADAETEAKKIAGVKSVKNNITVK